MDPIEESIDALVGKRERGLIALRRDIHEHPETAGQERRTAALVASRLRAAGLDVRTGVGGHGVVGVLTGVRPGRTVAYRADMDAVPPADQLGGDGAAPAHLCGHDLHTTIGVGIAEVLASLRRRLSGKVVFVFQPAEENLTGAAAMLGDGVFRGARPAEIHALHCGPLPVGHFAVMPGYGYPGQDHGVITVTGADAIPRARQLAADLSALGTVSPPITPEDLEQFLVDAGTPNGPLSEFIFLQAGVSDTATADRAEVRVSYRCWPEERYVRIRGTIRRLAASAGASAPFTDDPFPALKVPERDGRAVRRYLRGRLGRGRVSTMYASIPFRGEDFALFFDRLPGTYSYLGVRAPGAGVETSYPHLATFDPDERAIGHGVRAMAGWLATRT
ncbi:M20/M25/M40 family metallo-hydrolase [Tenggerimyces flavus]|uniref:M20/M25/M40 family metallo-hydrolase n=1 Tax=Tenggerimyces flavus TaxID=1708749 RepID=A0ABV7Y802_9ACTN|nr:M20/M25/M40 family metallo-hydrolase [Tenggerimyces flavus]MBM7785380.1 amidohydrolase [Tenggerimyces flavus]